MCGIFAYIGPKNSAKVCIDGLRKLEYRGYDSAGLAGIYDGKIHYCKQVGKVGNLESAWDFGIDLGPAISHTRWATHGKPTQDNAHPHFDPLFNVAVVHNGIIENHIALREMLKKNGAHFHSETDTEVIAQLIAHFYDGNLLVAVQKALSLMRGFWGIAVIHKDHPNTIVAASRENPIVIAHKNDETFLSSDANAFHYPDLDVLFLKNDEVALVTSNEIKVYDQSHSPVTKVSEKLELDNFTMSKGSYDHYMLKEIFEQPQTIQNALHNRFIEDFGTVEFENLALSLQELQSVKRIFILACGTSWHAACIAASMLEEKAHIPTQAEIASEFRYKNPIVSDGTLVIAVSQSGETLDTLAAVREVRRKGAKVLAVCNVRNSTLAREADATLFLRAGPEISVCSTKAFTSQITVLSLFTLLMGRLRHLSKEDGQAFLKELRNLPALVEAVLDKHPHIAFLAQKYAKHDHFFFLGRHYMYTASLEAALKLKEISYLHATGHPAGEMKHGPLALVDPELAVIGLCCNSRTYEKTLSNLTEVKSRGAPVLAFAFDGAPDVDSIADDVLFLPQICDELASVLVSVAAQLFAYYIAKERKTDIDQPRNLAKSVTVE